MANELLITLRVRDDGTAVLSSVSGQIRQLGAAAEQTGQSVGKAGQAAAQGGKGLQQSGMDAERAGANYDKLGQSVAMAQAKMLGLYAAVRGSYGLFEKAMDSVDYYEKAIIRMSAAATDALKPGTSQEELEAYYERMKVKYGELVEYAMIASAKYFANAREMLTVMEWATARGHDIGKREIDNIGLLVDKIKQLVPWIKQEGQVLQELNALWEGHARISDTLAKLVIDRLKMMGQISATEGKQVQKQFQAILEDWKKEGFGGFLEKVMGLFQGAKIASKDIQVTWESTKETISTTFDILARSGFKQVYKEIITYLQQVNELYLTGEGAEQRRAELAERVAGAWDITKKTLSDIKPIVESIFTFLGEAVKGYRALPEPVQEVGIVAFFLVGAKGAAAMVAVLGVLGRIKTLLDSLTAYASGNLSLWDLLFGDKAKLDKGIEALEEIRRRQQNILDFDRQQQEKPGAAPPKLRVMSGGGWFGAEDYPVFGHPAEYGPAAEGWGFWGGVTPAESRKQQIFDPRGGLKGLVREHEKAYDEIDGYRKGLDRNYYRDAVGLAQSMAQQVGGFYLGMSQAALKYYEESTNYYKQGVKVFGEFTWATEDLMKGFFDIIIWRTGKFTDVMTNFLKRLSNALLESLIIQPLVGLISGGLGSIFGGIGSSIFGGMGGFFGNMFKGSFGAPEYGYGFSGSTAEELAMLGNMSDLQAAREAGGFGAGLGFGGGGGGFGGGSMLALAGILGIGGLAALMGGEKEGGTAGGSVGGELATMSVQTMQVANLVVGGVSQGGGSLLTGTLNQQEQGKLAATVVGTEASFGSYASLFKGVGQAQEVDNILTDNLYATWVEIKGLENLADFVNEAGSRWEGSVETAGDILGDAAAVFRENIEKGGMSFKQSLEEIGHNFRDNIWAVFGGWIQGGGGSGAGSGGGSSFLGTVLDFGSWFHQGGVIKRAHSGMILGEDERLVVGQVGEGILQRRRMAEMGEANFQALNRGDYRKVRLPGQGQGSRELHVHVHVNALDGSSVSALDWERLVRGKIAPALKKVQREWIS